MQLDMKEINRSSWYWSALTAFGLLALGEALYFQHVLNEWPCMLCIHARIWVMVLTFVALFGLFVRRHPIMNAIGHGLTLLVSGGLLERSLVLLGTERETLFGECSMDLGLPAWLALDKWIPFLFEVQASCGYTPELWAGGLTMAEGLVATSVVLIMVSGAQLLLSLWLQLVSSKRF
jgi:disulfide bond formation protein DsbB